MKRNPAQPLLFDEISPLEAHAMPIFDLPAESADYCESCRGASVTLDGKPAKVIGGPSARFATIEPLDVDAEPIRCCWDIVQYVLDNHEGRFQRADDDTDD